ncbi:hypothetical protein [Methylobacterium sp. NFXW15]|uniref:hypothetical protein n=1 Tax=Methylobacterium sp. NFXW15 TaxID=2819512 RepID=UPI003CF064B3
MHEPLTWLADATLPVLGDAVEGAKARIEAGLQAVSDLGSSVASQAADAWERIEPSSFDLSWLSSLSSLSWPFGSDPVAALSSCPPLAEPAASAMSVAAAPSAEWGSTVGKSGLTWDLFFSNTGHDWSGEIDMSGLVRFLRGRYPDKTAANVSADTRLPADTVKKWLGLVAAPNGRAMLVLACVYGPEVLVAVLRRPPGWLVQSARMAEQVRLEAELAELTAKLARVRP